MNLKTRALRCSIVSLLVMCILVLQSGCATLAHRSSATGQNSRATANCAGGGDTCPWILGDALLLIPGIVPGVIAFAVDFGTGAWRHDGYAQTQNPTSDVTFANMQDEDR